LVFDDRAVITAVPPALGTLALTVTFGSAREARAVSEMPRSARTLAQ
jgi:hypothetical protein